MQALQVARAAEMQDTQRLVQQLSMARQKLAAIEAGAEAERCACLLFKKKIENFKHERFIHLISGARQAHFRMLHLFLSNTLVRFQPSLCTSCIMYFLP